MAVARLFARPPTATPLACFFPPLASEFRSLVSSRSRGSHFLQGSRYPHEFARPRATVTRMIKCRGILAEMRYGSSLLNIGGPARVFETARRGATTHEWRQFLPAVLRRVFISIAS